MENEQFGELRKHKELKASKGLDRIKRQVEEITIIWNGQVAVH